MAQFTAESLGRTLANVQREVLVDALEGEDLRILLRSETIDTIEQLQGFFNLAQNLVTFGPELFSKLILDQLEELSVIAPEAKFLTNIILSLITIFDQFDGRAQTILKTVSDIQQLLSGEVPFDILQVTLSVNRIATLATNLFNQTLPGPEITLTAQRILEEVAALRRLLSLR